MGRIAFWRSLSVLIAIAAGGASTFCGAAEKESAPAFEFRQVNFFLRWSKDRQYEFTPAKQEDLDHWSDMITINGYPDARHGEELAEVANTVLGNYKSHGGKILKTRSVPRTEEHSAEHLISVVFTRPDFAEAAFARFKLYYSSGYSLVYSHRFYGKKATEEMNAWLKANGQETEKALLEWDPNLEVWPAE
jgi:hypothetical protein